MRTILEVLGVDRLQLVLSQMQYALKEGNQRFILAYTLYDCVAAIRSSVHLTPEDVGFPVSTHDQPSTVQPAEGLNESKYPLLRSLSAIQDIVLYDYFDAGARAREVEELQKANASLFRELSVSHSLETWEIVTSLLPFLPNRASFSLLSRGSSLVHFWLAPIVWRVRSCEDAAEMTRLRSVLSATAKGLLANASVLPATLTAYCMSLLHDAERAISSSRAEAKQIAATTEIWTTSSVGPRSTSDGRRNLIVEREQKLTGTNLNEQNRKKVNKASEEEMLGFALQLLNGAVEKKLLVATDATHRRLAESFVDSLLFVLRTCRKASVVRDCLRFVDTLLQWKIDSMTQNVEPLRRNSIPRCSPLELLFSLLSDFSATSSELARALFHTLSQIYHLYPSRFPVSLMGRKTEMTVDQGRALLLLIRRDIAQSERQNAAFGMLRVILQRKLVFADLYDFMDELSTLLLQTFDDSLRNHCARVLLNFLLNYPMADKRVDAMLTFLLKNIEYEEPSGRLALLHLLLNLVKNFPVEVGIA